MQISAIHRCFKLNKPLKDWIFLPRYLVPSNQLNRNKFSCLSFKKWLTNGVIQVVWLIREMDEVVIICCMYIYFHDNVIFNYSMQFLL